MIVLGQFGTTDWGGGWYIRGDYTPYNVGRGAALKIHYVPIAVYKVVTSKHWGEKIWVGCLLSSD